jgi:hypothetical protein
MIDFVIPKFCSKQLICSFYRIDEQKYISKNTLLDMIIHITNASIAIEDEIRNHTGDAIMFFKSLKNIVTTDKSRLLESIEYFKYRDSFITIVDKDLSPIDVIQVPELEHGYDLKMYKIMLVIEKLNYKNNIGAFLGKYTN